MTTRDELYDQAMSCIERYASIVVKNPDNSATLNKLQSEMDYYCDSQTKYAALENALSDTMTEVDGAKTKDEAEELYKAYEKTVANIAKMSGQSHTRLAEFNATYLGETGECEEVLITQNTISVIDPISKMRMVDPVKNKKCGHHYEKSIVLQMIARNPATRCPMIGCTVKKVKAKDLVPDDQLRRYLADHVDERLEISAVDLDDTR